MAIRFVRELDGTQTNLYGDYRGDAKLRIIRESGMTTVEIVPESGDVESRIVLATDEFNELVRPA